MFLPIAIGLVVAALVVFALLAKRGGMSADEATGKTFSYTANDSLLTPAERSFYGTLKTCTGDQLTVFAKVRLADIFRPTKGVSGSEWRSAQNKLDRKHVDFLLCRADNLAPVAAIELDDSSHNRPESQKNDQFKNDLFDSSGVALLRVTAKQSYNSNEVAAAVNKAIASKKAAPRS